MKTMSNGPPSVGITSSASPTISSTLLESPALSILAFAASWFPLDIFIEIIFPFIYRAVILHGEVGVGKCLVKIEDFVFTFFLTLKFFEILWVVLPSAFLQSIKPFLCVRLYQY